MKISQLFLCWTFTRLHVTKHPAFRLVPVPPIQLYYQLNGSQANASTPTGLHGPALSPQNSMQMALRFSKTSAS